MLWVWDVEAAALGTGVLTYKEKSLSLLNLMIIPGEAMDVDIGVGVVNINNIRSKEVGQLLGTVSVQKSW